MDGQIKTWVWVLVSIVVALIGVVGSYIARPQIDNFISGPTDESTATTVQPSERETPESSTSSLATSDLGVEERSRTETSSLEDGAESDERSPDGTLFDCTESPSPPECSPTVARLDGDYVVDGTLIEISGSNGEIGETNRRIWTFDPRCADGSCGGTFRSSSGFSTIFDVDDTEGYFMDYTGQRWECQAADLARTVYPEAFLIVGGLKIEITMVEMRAGSPTVVGLTGTQEVEYTRTAEASERYCAESARTVYDFVGEFASE